MLDYPLRVNDLEKSFPKKLGLKRFKAVDGVGFDLPRGRILGFLGPNGAGKTTTIKCILGLLKPDSGKISIWGDLPASGHVRSRIGYVPENPDYEDIFTPMEMLTMFSSMRGLGMTTGEMEAILARVGLSGWERSRLKEFSKGMRQRVSLALALQSNPDLLIMDEPTGGLDPTARKEFRDIILEENRRGASVFLSSHLLSEVETICHRAVILSKGHKVAEGDLEDLLRTQDQYSIEYRLPEGDESSAKSIVVKQDVLQKTIDDLRGDGCFIERISPVYRTLEEVFLSATDESRTGPVQGG